MGYLSLWLLIHAYFTGTPWQSTPLPFLGFSSQGEGGHPLPGVPSYPVQKRTDHERHPNCSPASRHEYPTSVTSLTADTLNSFEYLIGLPMGFSSWADDNLSLRVRHL